MFCICLALRKLLQKGRRNCVRNEYMMNSTSQAKIDSADGAVSVEGQTTRQTLVIANCVLNGPLILISIIGNALLFGTIARTPSIRSTSLTMLCSLAVSDLLVGFIAQPLFIASELTRDPFVEKLSEMMGCALCGVSLCTMTAMSVDRFLAIHYPMRYQSATVAKPRIVYASIAAIWIVNVSSLGLYFWNWTTYFIIMAVGVCFCLLISTYSYIKIYRIVRRHQVQIRSQEQAAAQRCNGPQNFRMKRVKRTAINTFIFYVAMALCYVPILISLSLSSISFENWTKTWHFADTVVFLNSSINPLLYCWRLGDLRAAIAKTVKIILCRKTDLIRNSSSGSL